jgi:hypothetical protein
MKIERRSPKDHSMGHDSSAGTVEYRYGCTGGTETLTNFLRCELPNGNEVYTARVVDHPHDDGPGPKGLRLEFYGAQPDGTRTRLAFDLTEEACSALAAMFVLQGVAPYRADKPSERSTM